jgi:hypothetical protein
MYGTATSFAKETIEIILGINRTYKAKNRIMFPGSGNFLQNTVILYPKEQPGYLNRLAANG